MIVGTCVCAVSRFHCCVISWPSGVWASFVSFSFLWPSAILWLHLRKIPTLPCHEWHHAFPNIQHLWYLLSLYLSEMHLGAWSLKWSLPWLFGVCRVHIDIVFVWSHCLSIWQNDDAVKNIFRRSDGRTRAFGHEYHWRCLLRPVQGSRRTPERFALDTPYEPYQGKGMCPWSWFIKNSSFKWKWHCK